jgi:hypothetical protein
MEYPNVKRKLKKKKKNFAAIAAVSSASFLILVLISCEMSVLRTHVQQTDSEMIGLTYMAARVPFT